MSCIKFVLPVLAAAMIAIACSTAPGSSSSSGSSGTSSSSSSSGSGSSSSSGAPVDIAIESNSIFVSALGNDTNSGLLKTEPLFSLQQAVDLAKVSNLTSLYISGNLMLTNLTNTYGVLFDSMTNLDVSGGWDSSFSSRSGESLLNGNKAASHVVGINSCYGLTLRGLHVTGGNDGASYGAGIAINNSCSNRLDCTVSSNYGMFPGIYIANSHSNYISGTIISNYANAGAGGGIYMGYSGWNRIDAAIVSNYARNMGGGVYATFGISNIISGPVKDNVCSTMGGGICLDYCRFITVSSLISGNKSGSGWDGGGIDLYRSTNCNISGDVVGNISYATGGGITLNSSVSNTITGNIISNTAVWGGGMMIYCSFYNTISGSILSNYASGTGGGIQFWYGSNNIVSPSCRIRYNSAVTNGGGIYQEELSAARCEFVSSNAVITNNYLGAAEQNIYSKRGFISNI